MKHKTFIIKIINKYTPNTHRKYISCIPECSSIGNVYRSMDGNASLSLRYTAPIFSDPPSTLATLPFGLNHRGRFKELRSTSPVWLAAGVLNKDFWAAPGVFAFGTNGSLVNDKLRQVWKGKWRNVTRSHTENKIVKVFNICWWRFSAITK